jgi:hypothetical protein
MNNEVPFYYTVLTCTRHRRYKEGLEHRAADLYPIEVGHCNTNNLDNKQVEGLIGSWRLTNKTVNK